MEHYVLKIGKVLLHQWLIQAVLGLQRRLGRRGDRLFPQERAARHGVHDEEGHRDDHPDRQDGQTDALQDIGQGL